MEEISNPNSVPDAEAPAGVSKRPLDSSASIICYFSFQKFQFTLSHLSVHLL